MSADEHLEERLTAAEQEIAGLAELVNDLTDTVNTLTSEQETRTPRAWWWPGLDQTQAEHAWQTLASWVEQYLLPRQPRYAQHVRPCWRLHPEVVDELTALRVAWLAAYRHPRPRPTAASEYLARWLPQAMARIEAAFTATECEPGHYGTHHDPAAGPPPAWTDAQVTDFLSTDLADRPDPADS